jgi:mRNA-degrading endonuclease RelE of RelBE toxin-antitoxin system
MAKVILTAAAQAQFLALPSVIQSRVTNIIERLVDWPQVSGAKRMRRELKGNLRIRTGDYRVVFNTTADDSVVTIWRIENRKSVYD